ncbi:MAG TPA: CocE/NonD family hydrolase [Anaerolineales bacterium]|nr:CocE/NonD family hydrolase [Anaerolineales bacterium]
MAQTVEQGVELIWGHRLPMRDGVELNGTVYKPEGQTKPLPVVFTLTPYISDSYHPRGMYFARNGYVFVIVDVRGRGNSGGTFEPFMHDGRDGHDIVEHLARQPWCDGQVAMWGGSYAGYNQWAALKEFPKHLATIVPAAAAHPGVDFPFANNIFYSYETQWLTFTSGVTGNANLFGEQTFWIGRFREMYLNHRPFKELDQIVGNPSPHFQKWLKSPTADHWEFLTPSSTEYSRIHIPILTITGHYDGDQPGAMTFYRNHMRYGSARGRARHYLLFGPWDHAGTRTPNKEFGGLKFAEASVLDLNQLHKQWYDWTMKDGPKPDFLKKRVAYYVMGEEKWKYVDTLEKAAPARRRLYLNSDGGSANDAFRSGALSDKKPGRSQPDTYAYDPLDLRPAELEREEVKDYLADQRYALHLFGNGLIYHSEPLAEDTEITGWARAVLWLALDASDTDFTVTLSEVLLNGQSILLTQDMLRARYRKSFTHARLVTPGQIERYEFNRFTFFSRRIAKYSRLRLVINSPNSIYFQKNYNGGGVVAEETAKDARTAHVTLYHDAARPSFLELPVAPIGRKSRGQTARKR